MRPSHLRRANNLPRSLRQILSQPLPGVPVPSSSTANPSPSESPSTPPSTIVNGWIKSVRLHKSVTFLEVSDGSCADTLQAVLKDKGKGKDIGVEGLTLGTSLQLHGHLLPSKGKKQSQELSITSLRILGPSDPESYPIQKKHLPPDVLRSQTHGHFRARTAGFGAGLRVRDGLKRGWEGWFEDNEFVHIQTPIMTSSDCEGAGEAFRVTTLPAPSTTTPLATSTSQPSPEDFFPTPTFLTVSSQLHLESPTHALSRCYTFSPAFRAEGSATSRHLAEFWMLEAEVGWLDFDEGDIGGEREGSKKALEQVMGTLEDGLRAVIGSVVDGANAAEGRDRERSIRIRRDLEAVWEGVAKDLEEARPSELEPDRHIPTIPSLAHILSRPFHRITYTRAIDILQKRHHRTKPFAHPPVWGSSLQSEHEKYLAGWECLDGPVFVTDYPRKLKPFYMRRNPSVEGVPGETVSCFDLLIPHVGELAGGSVREERLPYLERAIEEAGLDKRAYDWYLDLRRFGSFRHGGWGMGWERFMCWITGVGNVRDVVPFPRWKGSCRY